LPSSACGTDSVEARHSQEVIATANGLQTLVIDRETGAQSEAHELRF